MISQDELDKILPSMEEDRIEKTVSLNDFEKFGEAICSFANDLPKHNKPGYLIIGANNDGSRCGLNVEERLLQNLMDFRTDGRIVPPPSLVVSTFRYADGEVAVVEVQPSFQPPVRYKGKVCVRIGPRKGTANDADERILSEKRSSFAATFDTLPCYNSSLKDISVDIFKNSYLPHAIDEETLHTNGREIREQLASLKFYDLKSDCPTNAGLLMFGVTPHFFLHGAYVQYVHFTGVDETSPFDYEIKFEGDLTSQMRIMELFIKTQVVKKVLKEIGGEHEFNYALSALKELLFNAVIHRDYQSNAPIKFYEYTNRIEISNAGGLYGKARPENFPMENDYRNPAIAEAAYNLGYINRFNLGVKRAKDALMKNGNPEPHFIFNQPSHFQVTIFKKEF